MTSEPQLTANRANAQLSTGPRSPEGKAKVSHNALKTGLTGRTVLLPSDDVAAYQEHVARLFRQFAPETDEEKDEPAVLSEAKTQIEDEPAVLSEAKTQIRRLVQSLADTQWRLDRIPALETGIYAIGRREFAGHFADETEETVRRAMIEAQILLTYRRDLNNLSTQEARLQYEKDEAELKRLLAEREAAAKAREKAERDRWKSAIDHYQTAEEFGVPFDPAEIGFEFTTEEIAHRLEQQKLRNAIACGRYYEYKAKGWLKRAS